MSRNGQLPDDVATLAYQVMSPRRARGWWTGAEPMLDGRSPAQIYAEDPERVARFLRWLVQGY